MLHRWVGVWVEGGGVEGLARALYQPGTRLFLLDDLLASLDSHVAQVRACFHEWLLGGGLGWRVCGRGARVWGNLLCLILSPCV
jgi:hypothetical protein